MKKTLSVIFMFVVLVISGCSDDKATKQSMPTEPKIEQPAPEPEKIEAVLVAGSFWVADSENIPFLADAIKRKDVEYMKQLMRENKVFLVEKNTKDEHFGIVADKSNVKILFREGRYTNKTGYIHASNVIAKKEFPAYLEKQKQKKLI